MICPHCKKEIGRKDYVDKQLREERNNLIIKSISIANNGISIAELCRKTGIVRSTMRYYIRSLLIDNIISQDRKLNLAGRPTLLKLKNKK